MTEPPLYDPARRAQIGDRTEIRSGMKVSAVYEVPEGIVSALGYDTLELTVSR